MKSIAVLVAVFCVAECISLGEIVSLSKSSSPKLSLRQLLRHETFSSESPAQQMDRILDQYESELLKLNHMIMNVEQDHSNGMLVKSEVASRLENIEQVTRENLDNTMALTKSILENQIEESARHVVSKITSILRSVLHHFAKGSVEEMSLEDSLKEIIETLKTETEKINKEYKMKLEKIVANLKAYFKDEKDMAILEKVVAKIMDVEFCDFELVMKMAKEVCEKKSTTVPEGIVEFFDLFHRHLSSKASKYFSKMTKISEQLVTKETKMVVEKALEMSEWETIEAANAYFDLVRTLAERVAEYYSGVGPKVFGTEITNIEGALKVVEMLELEMVMVAGGENFEKVKQMIVLIGRRFNDDITRTAAVEAIDEIELHAADLIAEEMFKLHHAIRQVEEKKMTEHEMMQVLDEHEERCFEVLGHLTHTISEVVHHQLVEPAARHFEVEEQDEEDAESFRF